METPRRTVGVLAATLGRPAGWLAVVLAASVFAGLVLAMFPLPASDRAAAAWLHAQRTPLLDGVMRAGTWLGSIAFLMPAALGWAIWRWRRGALPVIAAAVPVALAGAWGMGALAKVLVDRARPDLFAPLVDLPADASFPSGHTLQAAAVAVAWALRPGVGPAIPGGVAWAAALGFVGFVGLSRVYLQVHWLTDVLAGAALGAACALVLRPRRNVRGG